jgi:Subtilase family
MPSIRRALSATLTVAAILALATPASAATPAGGSVSQSSPSVTWTGTAPGYAVDIVNSLDLVRTCLPNICDGFALDVADGGDLTISATANGTSGFTQVHVIKPDGAIVSNDGESGNPTSEIRIKNADPGAYFVAVHTNAPVVLADATYHASATLADPAAPHVYPPDNEGQGEGGKGDVTVVAVIDSSFNPYHWDFLASRMPQATNSDPGDDLPLDRPASDWLPGFPADSSFGSFGRVDLSLEETDGTESVEALAAKDKARWAAIPRTTPGDNPHLVWFPHTKVIAAASFGSGSVDPLSGASTSSPLIGGTDAHGLGTTSASVGNLHGTCPECLLVFLQYSDDASGEAAIEWAMKQPWIDEITNSYGFQTVGDHGPVQVRDNVYSGSDNAAQKAAIERGQTVLFSAGNGIENAFVTPNSTTFSSQKGPDWMITVGAISPPENGYYPSFTDDFLGADVTEEKEGGFVGAGKPVDVASLGTDYPTAYESPTVGGTGSFGFSGTSNATPVIAGIYGRSLYTARTQLPGVSRIQDGGVIATGDPIACGSARPGCELGDGRLTGDELRTRLVHGAVPTGNGLTISGQIVNPTLPKVGEETLLAEGHGVYLGRVTGDPNDWLTEQLRITGPLTGQVATLTRPEGERDWMVVDSYCRQQNWGSWTHGYYVAGQTQLPGNDPNWPVRSLLERTCPGGPLP